MSKLHVLQQHLPPSYNASIPAEQAASIEFITSTVRNACSDTDVDFKALSRVVKWLEVHTTTLKYTFSNEDVLTLFTHLWRAAQDPACGIQTQTKLLSALTTLLSEKRHGLKGRLPNLTVLQLHDLVASNHLRQDDQFPLAGGTRRSRHRSAVLRFIRASRWYLGPESGQLIYDFLRPGFDVTRGDRMFEAQTLLQLLYPPHVPAATALVQEWVALWDREDHNPGWDAEWMSLFVRAAKYGDPGLVNWVDLLPALFFKIQHSLPLTVRGTAKISKSKRPCFVRNISMAGNGTKKAAKLIVHLLGHGSTGDQDGPSPGMIHMQQVLHAASTFFHPSNTGNHAVALGVFLETLCSSFAKRLGRERALAKYQQRDVRVDAAAPTDNFYNIQLAPLGVYDKRQFVQELIPLIEMGLYSKNTHMVNSAQAALRHIAWVAPSTVYQRFVPSIFNALDPRNVHLAHQVPAAIKSLTVTIQPLLQVKPILAPDLVQLLELALPGIDINDKRKTINTYALFHAVFSWISVVDTSNLRTPPPSEPMPFQFLPESVIGSNDGQPYSYGIDQDDHPSPALLRDQQERMRDKMWRSGPRLVELVRKLLDKLFTQLEHKEESSKSSFLDTTVTFTFLVLNQLLFSQMHPDVKAYAHKRIFDFVTSKRLKHAEQAINGLLGECSASRPQETMDLFVPALAKRISDPNADKDDVQWCVSLFGSICRKGGAAMLPHEDTIVATIKTATSHQEYKVRKAGGKMLRRVMRGLVEQYVVEHAAFENMQDWSKLAVQWGTMTSWSAVNPHWHTPNDQEIAFAVRLFKHYYQLVHGVLNAHMEGGGESSSPAISKEEWRSNLRLLHQIIRGCLCIIDDQFEVPEQPKTAVGGRCVYGQPDNPAACLDYQTYSRSAILRTCNEFARYVLAQRPTDTVAHRYVIKILVELGVSQGAFGGEGRKHRAMSAWSKYSHKLLQSNAIEAELRAWARLQATASMDDGHLENRADWLVPRCKMVDAVETLHLSRVHQAGFTKARALRNANMDHAYQDTFGILIDMCFNEWIPVRNFALGAFRMLATRFGWLGKSQMATLIDTLRIDDADMETITGDKRAARVLGAIYLLQASKSINWISSDWALLSKFIRISVFHASETITTLPNEKQKETQEQLQLLYSHVLGARSSLPVTTNQHAELRTGLIEDLIAHGLEEGRKKWKNELMVVGALYSLLRAPDAPYAKSLLPKLRPIADAQWWRLVVQLAHSDVFPVKLAAVRLLDCMIVVHYSWKPVLLEEAGEHLDAVEVAARDLLEQDSFLAAVTNVLEQDHLSSHSGADGSTRGAQSKWSAGVTELVNLPKLTRTWPYSSYTRSSTSFISSHAFFVAGLTRTCGCSDGVLEKLGAAVDQLLEDDTGKEYIPKLSTAAEILSGLMVSVGNVAIQDPGSGVALLDRWSRKTVETLDGLAGKLSSATASDWVDALRFMTVGGDMARCGAVVEYLVGDISKLLNASAGSSSFGKTSNVLRFLNAILVGLGYAASLPTGDAKFSRIATGAQDQLAKFRKDMVPLLLSGFSNPYKAIRENVARTLFILMHSSQVADLSVEWVAATAKSIRDELAPVIDEPMDAPANKDEALVNRLWSTLYFLMVCICGGEFETFGEIMLALLPIVFAVQGHADQDVAQTGKNVLDLVSANLRVIPSSSEATNANAYARCIIANCKAPKWRHRAASVKFARLFYGHHIASLSKTTQLEMIRTIEGLLLDNQLEVQEEARLALTGIWAVSGCEWALVEDAFARYQKQTVQKLPKIFTRAGRERATNEGLSIKDEKEKAMGKFKKRHAGVLGLTAIVLAFPYTIPGSLPSIVSSLSRHVSDPMPIGKAATHALSEFKRTHQDEWEKRKHLFSYEQLRELEGLLVSPSYYA